MSIPTTRYSVLEGSSARFQASLIDETGAAVPAATLTSLTLRLFAQYVGTVINSRNNQNVLNANNVTIDSAGLLTWTVTPADNAIVDDTKVEEVHIAEFRGLWSAGTKGFAHRFEIVVKNLAIVP